VIAFAVLIHLQVTVLKDEAEIAFAVLITLASYCSKNSY
jgi:hypothetical protein